MIYSASLLDAALNSIATNLVNGINCSVTFYSGIVPATASEVIDVGCVPLLTFTGITWQTASAGVIARKEGSIVAPGLATGTTTFFRIYEPVVDVNPRLSTTNFRIQGTCSNIGSDAILDTTSIVLATVYPLGNIFLTANG